MKYLAEGLSRFYSSEAVAAYELATHSDGGARSGVRLSVDMNKLSQGEKIFGASALLLVVLSFIKFWAKVEVGGDLGDLGGVGGTVRGNAWDVLPGYGKIGLFLAILGIVFVLIRAAGSVQMPVQAGLVYLILGGITALVMVLAAIVGPDDAGAGLFGVEVSRGPLLFVGAILGLAMAYGGWTEYQAGGGTATTGMGTPPSTPPPPAS